MKKHGFTLMEVIISCGILALFMTGVMTLYTQGGKIGNNTMWVQNTTNKLKLAARQINTSISKSSYPSVITFPDGITQIKKFTLKYKEKKFLASSAKSGDGTNFLEIIEAKPAKTGFGKDEDATIFYHLYSLNKNGDLIFTLCENKNIKANNIKDSMTIGKSNPKKVVLAKDVESIECKKIGDAGKSPIEVTITCKMPKSNTIREEKTVGVPNVDVSTL